MGQNRSKSGRLSPGTMVRLKVNLRKGRIGRVIEEQPGLAIVALDGVTAMVGHDEVAVMSRPPAGWESMRTRLPYGWWTDASGRAVLFNREYRPIRQRRPGRKQEIADPNERVAFVEERWLYADHTSPWINKKTLARCEAALAGGPLVAEVGR